MDNENIISNEDQSIRQIVEAVFGQAVPSVTADDSDGLSEANEALRQEVDSLREANRVLRQNAVIEGERIQKMVDEIADVVADAGDWYRTKFTEICESYGFENPYDVTSEFDITVTLSMSVEITHDKKVDTDELRRAIKRALNQTHLDVGVDIEYDVKGIIDDMLDTDAYGDNAETTVIRGCVDAFIV
jgi:hypothetical protein